MPSADNFFLLEATFAVFCSAALLIRLLLPNLRRTPSGEALMLLVLGGGVIVTLTSLAGFLGGLCWQSLFAESNALLVCTGLVAMAKPELAGIAKMRDSLGHLRSIVSLRWLVRPSRGFACLLALAVLVILAGLGVIALLSPGMNFDSNTYRLPRIAYWLQQGNLFAFPTNDPKMNYTGHNADLVMLWIIAFADQGYRHAALAQWFGGLIAAFAIYETGRLLRFEIELRLAAVLFFCGLPTIATQFISTQFDLFTAGFLAATLTFVLGAFRSGQVRLFALAGIAFGIALGAKATVLFFLPACLRGDLCIDVVILEQG